MGGCEVRLHDIHQVSLDTASARIAQAFQLLKEAGEISVKIETAADLPITMSTDLAISAAHADIFIDAAAESEEVKRLVFKEADRLCPLDCILTSTTSMLDVFPLIATRRLSRFCVVHWYSPPYIIDLVEIAPGQETDPAVASKLSTLYAGMGKKPVVFDHFFPGYVANRVQTAITREIMSILDEGLATPAQIDDSLRHGLALRMALLGHLMRSDFTSLKLVQANLATVSDRGPAPRSILLNELISQGHNGVSTGKGFFNYAGRSPANLCMERDRKLLAMKKALHCIEPIYAKPFDPGQIRS